MIEEFLLAFVPLFIAIDAFGTLPLFVSMTDGYTPEVKRTIAGQATLTAMLAGTGFLFAGAAIMKFLGITLNDFRVAGGIILLCFAVYDLLFSHLQRSISEQQRAGYIEQKNGRVSHSLAIVPLGIPLIVGPAAFTALLLLGGQHGSFITLYAFALNILFVYVLFAYAHVILRRVPQAVMRALSKVVALFLAAIAIMMVRTGLTAMFHLASH